MEGFYLALGATIVLPFLQWAVPSMPRVLAYAGVAGGIAVMFAEFLGPTMKPPFSVVVLFLTGVLCIGGAAHLYIQNIKRPTTAAAEATAPSPATSKTTDAGEQIPAPRGPTLEATNGSTIDATGSIIPGDLPFQFGKADGGSVIDMPGTVVTRRHDGSILIEPGKIPVNRVFPAPTGEFSNLSNEEMRARAHVMAASLRDFQRRFDAENRTLPRLPPPQHGVDNELWKGFFEKYHTEYREKFADQSLSIASEIMSRIEAAAPGTRIQHAGALMLYHKTFAGPRAALEVADFLDMLANYKVGQN